MNEFDQQWHKLTALARQAPADPGAGLPPGFATRVAARAAAAPAAGPWFALERFALRGFIAAAVCGVAAAAYGLPSLSTEPIDLYATGTADTVVDLLDLS
jgi:hypothetical protein